MKLLLITQNFENYAWNDDGTLGTGDNAYWKAKGGDEFFVMLDDQHMTWPLNGYINSVISKVSSLVEIDNDGFRRIIIGHEIVPDDFQTEFELSQLEYDGTIHYPTEIIDLSKIT